MFVGDLVLKAAHSFGIVHDFAVFVLLWDRYEGIASYTILETFTTVIVRLVVTKVVGPELDFEVGGIPCETTV